MTRPASTPAKIRRSEAQERIGVGRTKFEELVALGAFTVDGDGIRYFFADELDRWNELAGPRGEKIARMIGYRIRMGRLKARSK